MEAVTFKALAGKLGHQALADSIGVDRSYITKIVGGAARLSTSVLEATMAVYPGLDVKGSIEELRLAREERKAAEEVNDAA